MSKKANYSIVFVLVALGLAMLTSGVGTVDANTLVGDVNGDGEVNIEDLVMAAQAFGSYTGHPRWDERADVNGDGAVDIMDISLILGHYGEDDSSIIEAEVHICPHTLNLKSRGRWIIAFIRLPEGYDPHGIDVSTIMLNSTIPAEPRPIAVVDCDCDGVPVMIVKFDRQKVIDLIRANHEVKCKCGTVTLTVTGKWKDEEFQGSDTIKVIMPRTYRHRCICCCSLQR